MNLREILDHAAAADRWHHTPLSGQGTTVEFTSPFGDEDHSDNGFVSHSGLLVSIDIPEISIAYGLDTGDQFEWMTDDDPEMPLFSDATTGQHAADIRFSGALVHREHLWLVDGFRCWLPAPRPVYDRSDPSNVVRTGHSVTTWEVGLSHVIDSNREVVSEFDSYLSRTGWNIIPGHPLDDSGR